MTNRWRNFCFTSFSPILADTLDRPMFKYLVMQKEVCPNTQREHWQGYAELKSQRRLNGVKEALGDEKAHIEPRRGTAKEAADYCKKAESAIPDTIVEFGQISGQGRRSDVENMVSMIREGKSNLEILDEMPGTYARMYKAADRIRWELQRASTSRWRNLEVIVLYGATGTGKTRFAIESCPPEESLFKLDVANNLWWDGYSGESTLVLDDFYGWIKYGLLLNVLDGYPLRLEVKGGFTRAAWTRVIVTSNKHPRDWYKDPQGELVNGVPAALARRITSIYRCDSMDRDAWVDESDTLKPGGSDSAGELLF